MSSPNGRVVSANPLKHEVVRPDKLDNLKYYKYSGKDNSLLSKYVLCHWWNFCVNLLPVTMAANQVTLIGFLIALIGPVATIYHMITVDVDPTTIPSWIWYVSGVALFMYQTLDAIDGKQARRTFACGPLGEIFDHGCDVLQAPLDLMMLALCLGFSNDRIWLQFFIGSLCVVLAITEQYSTGTLDLGVFNGPVEGLIIMSIGFVWTGFSGVAWWTTPFATGPYTIPMVPAELFAFRNASDVMFVISLAAAAAGAWGNVVGLATQPYAHDGVRPFRAISVHAIFALLFVAVYFVLPRSIASQSPLAFEMAFGLLNSITATRLTVSRLCRTPYVPTHYYSMGFVALCVASLVAQLSGFANASTYRLLGYAAYALSAFGVVFYLHMMLAIFRQFSGWQKCHVLTLTEEQKRKALEAHRK